MIHKLLFSFSWVVLSSSLILGGYYSYLKLYPQTATPQLIAQENQAQIHMDRGEEPSVLGSSSDLEVEDGRAVVVAQFLEKYDHIMADEVPLQPYDHYAQMLVEIADRYQIDFRLLPAIMMQESQLCTKIPEGTYNCLGFGIHSRGTLGFENWEAGFDRAARELKANYVNQGRLTVSDIARKYTASVDAWTSAVNQFMTEMEYNDRAKGKTLKRDANVMEYVPSVQE